MKLVCPICVTPGLGHVTSIELPAPSVYQELELQIVACPHCDFRGAAVYLESRAGRLDSEIVHHFAYTVEADELDQIEGVIATCPDRRSKRCGCSAHESLLDRYEFGEPGFMVGFRGKPRPMAIPFRR